MERILDIYADNTTERPVSLVEAFNSVINDWPVASKQIEVRTLINNYLRRKFPHRTNVRMPNMPNNAITNNVAPVVGQRRNNNANSNANSNVNTNNNANVDNFKRWALNANSGEEFSTKCETLLTDVDPMYEEFSRKIAKICDSISVSPDYPTGRKKRVYNLTSRRQQEGLVLVADPDKPADSLAKAIRGRNFSKLPLEVSLFNIQYEEQE